MPAWLEQIVIQILSKYLTPEIVAKLEQTAKEYVVCLLAKLAKTTPTDIDDVIVGKVAVLLGVDLTKCPA